MKAHQRRWYAKVSVELWWGWLGGRDFYECIWGKHRTTNDRMLVSGMGRFLILQGKLRLPRAWIVLWIQFQIRRKRSADNRCCSVFTCRLHLGLKKSVNFKSDKSIQIWWCLMKLIFYWGLFNVCSYDKVCLHLILYNMLIPCFCHRIHSYQPIIFLEQLCIVVFWTRFIENSTFKCIQTFQFCNY